MGKELKVIPIGEIAQNPVALRNVDRQSQDFILLMDDIKHNGILKPILVRPSKEGSELPYELIDGLQRFTASLEGGLTEIPAQVMSMDDAKALQIQMSANIHNIKTKPVEYAKQIQRILATNPTMTISQISTDLSTPSSFISERLGLLKLSKEIGELVDNNKINLSNAFALAKLPPEEQVNYVQAAMSDKPAAFVPTVQARVKEIREALRAGRTAGIAAFEAQPAMRKRSELVPLLEDGALIVALVKESGVKTPIDAANLILKWVLQMDDASVTAKKAKFDQRAAQLDAEKAKRKAERDKKKAEESAKAAANVAAAEKK